MLVHHNLHQSDIFTIPQNPGLASCLYYEIYFYFVFS